MSASPRIVVIGSSNTDLVITGDRLPAPGETVIGGVFKRFAGGKGANQAVAAARAGAAVHFIGACGEDEFGAAAQAAIAAEGIDCSHFYSIPRQTSGIALILIGGADRENLISVAGGANDRLTDAMVEAAESAIAHADVVLASLEVPLEAVLHGARIAAEYGVRFILNPAPMPAGGLPQELLSLCSWVVPNEVEAAALANVDVPMIITLGARGCQIGGTVIAAPEVQAVDSVGAGDCFCAWFALGLAEGMEPEDAAERACRAAAIAVTRSGAQLGMPTASELAR